jgi:glyoxylase-like metal-dependent hydrolase (beta-lactamase superfamily II)
VAKNSQGCPRLRLPGGQLLYLVDTTPDFYRIPYIVSYILDPGPGEPLVVVDSGPRRPGAERLAAVLESLGADRRGVVVYVTHVHIDHGGAAGTLARRLGGSLLRVYAHPRGAPHLVDPEKLWRASRSFLGWIAEGYGEPEPLPEELVSATRDSEAHRYGGTTVRVLHTPGHASHHQSIVAEAGGEKILFPGDSASIAHPAVDAVAPTTPPPLRLDMYRESLRRQIAEKPSLVCYTHTGPGQPQLLERHLAQLDVWEREALRLVEEKRGGDPGPDELLARVAAFDTDTLALLELASRESPALLEALRHSAMGFLEAAQRALRGRRPA